jgi:alpha,alpha-trehalase
VRPRTSLVIALAALFFPPSEAVQCSSSGVAGAAPPERDILKYISQGWGKLTRSTDDCASLVDPKLGNSQQPLVYLPQNTLSLPNLQSLQAECKVRVEVLPQEIIHLGDVSPESLPHQGLLYLPHPYVVPGGKFNEMYGWDSYFIIRGLIEDGDLNRAQDMVENFFFEIDNYGAVLNANRTYYLTRSQPPFLTSMILAVYHAQRSAGHADRTWLLRAYTHAQRDYQLWTSNVKLAGGTGLSRYFDVGTGPVPEIGDDPAYYASVADWLVRHPLNRTGYLAANRHAGIGPEIHMQHCGQAPCEKGETVRFSAGYYKGDRAMRESGFDISFRFGPFGGSTHHFIPVCLNSLLYKEEKDMEEMARMLGRAPEARLWQRRAARRRTRVNHFLWNPRLEMFTDYNFYTGRASAYRYATTFYPLWTGLATKAQANAVMKHLGTFEQPGGICMSNRQTGVQWDKPYAWAPIQMLAVEGMRRYGYRVEADRVTGEFLTMVQENFLRDGTIREKYNALNRSTEVDITAGYQSNVVGFGWTNASFIVLLHQLAPEDQNRILTTPSSVRKQQDQVFPRISPAAGREEIAQPGITAADRKGVRRTGIMQQIRPHRNPSDGVYFLQLRLGVHCNGTETTWPTWAAGIRDWAGLHEHRSRRCLYKQRARRYQSC